MSGQDEVSTAADHRWRPEQRIRLKVIGIAKSQGAILVCEVLDDGGALTGWCPLGGSVDFGETCENALRREMREELNCEIEILGTPIVCENFYDHHGTTGHEIVFACPTRLLDPKLYENERFQMREHIGTLHWVQWGEIERFRTGKEQLFPTAIAEKIIAI